jgi:hypothetical protein
MSCSRPVGYQCNRKKIHEAASPATSIAVQRICSACAAEEREDKRENTVSHSLSSTASRSFPNIARQQIAQDKVALARSSNCQWLAQRQTVSSDEDKKKISAKPLNYAPLSSSHMQRKTDRGEDGSDYVKLTIPDDTLSWRQPISRPRPTMK